MNLVEEAAAQVRRGDVAAAIEMLTSDARVHGMKALLDAAGEVYWNLRDLPAFLSIAEAGVRVAMSCGNETTDPQKAAEWKSAAKSLSYNIASFTWLGWDEPGILITPAQRAVGMQAAAANLRLARELNKGPLAESRAHWMLAGHHLADGDFAAATAGYTEAARFAKDAGDTANRLLGELFAALVAALRDPATADAYDAAVVAMRTAADGDAFVTQADTARRVFTR